MSLTERVPQLGHIRTHIVQQNYIIALSELHRFRFQTNYFTYEIKQCEQYSTSRALKKTLYLLKQIQKE